MVSPPCHPHPRTNSPVIAGMYVPGGSPLGHFFELLWLTSMGKLVLLETVQFAVSRLQVPASTVKRYLNLLDLPFITRRIPAWSTNLTTRAVATSMPVRSGRPHYSNGPGATDCASFEPGL